MTQRYDTFDQLEITEILKDVDDPIQADLTQAEEEARYRLNPHKEKY